MLALRFGATIRCGASMVGTERKAAMARLHRLRDPPPGTRPQAHRWSIVGRRHLVDQSGRRLHHEPDSHGAPSRDRGGSGAAGPGGELGRPRRGQPAKSAAADRCRCRRVREVMWRWFEAHVPKSTESIPGMPDHLIKSIRVPTLIGRGGANDIDRPRRTSFEVPSPNAGSTLIARHGLKTPGSAERQPGTRVGGASSIHGWTPSRPFSTFLSRERRGRRLGAWGLWSPALVEEPFLT